MAETTVTTARSGAGGWTWMAIAGLSMVPGIALALGIYGASEPVKALIYGIAIIGAAFLLSWAAEAVQLDFSQGLALALASHFGFTIDHLSTEWLTMGIGLWLLCAPFLLGFAANPLAAFNAVAVGALIAALSASALELDREIGRILSRLIAGH